MSAPLFFDVITDGQGRAIRTLGICASRAACNPAVLESQLSTFLRSNRIPERVCIFGVEEDINHLRDTFFEGSPEKVVEALVGDESLSNEELERMAEMIRDARREGRRK